GLEVLEEESDPAPGSGAHVEDAPAIESNSVVPQKANVLRIDNRVFDRIGIREIAIGGRAVALGARLPLVVGADVVLGHGHGGASGPVYRPEPQLRIILARRTNDDVADVHVRRLLADESDGAGDVLWIQHRADAVDDAFEPLVLVAGDALEL